MTTAYVLDVFGKEKEGADCFLFKSVFGSDANVFGGKNGK